jgi:phenylacetate-CoA ligase
MGAYRIIGEDCLGFLSRPRRDLAAIKRLQDSRLRRIVAHAARAVPYYRRVFSQAGLDPRDIRGAEDLPLIPAASKPELRSTPLAERLARGVDPANLVRQMTSGSTGEPMPVLRTRIENALVHAYQLRSQLLCGVPFRARRAKVGKQFNAGPLHRLGVLPTLDVPAARRTPESILEELRRWRPDLLDIRPGVLEILVQAAERPEAGRDWPWRWMVCGGEVLPDDLRRTAEAVFGARVLNRYGAHEVGQLCWECPQCGLLHCNDDSVVVEVVRDGKPARPGETGEVLVTGLLSFAMPVLRFPLGDRVRQGPPMGEPGCPFAFASISAIEGRRLDNLLLADGRSIPSYGVMAALRGTPGVAHFQVVQESVRQIRIHYVAVAGDPGPELERRFREALPVPAMQVAVERVPEIAPDASGKRRYIRSLAVTARPS